MNKRGVFASLIGVFLSIPSVLAQGGVRNIGETLYKVFGWIFVDLSQHTGDKIYFFWIKFLLWVLLFSVYYYGTLKVFKEAQKRLAVTVALVLSLMSVILIPNQLLVTIMKTYTAIAALLVMAIPIIAVFMINHYAFKGEDNPAFNGVRAILYLLIGFIFANIAGFEEYLDFKYFASWAGFAEALCIIAAIYNIIKVIMGVSGPPGAATTWPRRPGAPPARPGEPGYPTDLARIIDRIGTPLLPQFEGICRDYRTAIEHVLIKNRHNVETAIHANPTCGHAVGQFHPIGWGRTQARNYTCPAALGPYAPGRITITITPDNAPDGLIPLTTVAVGRLAEFNRLSAEIRALFDRLFNDADFVNLSDHDRGRAATSFTTFSQRESDTLLFRVMAYHWYEHGQLAP